MSQINISDKELLISLTRQLNEINIKLGSVKKESKFSTGEWSFLFGFNPAGSVSRKDYLRYNIFMKAVTDILCDYGIHMNNKGYTYIVESVMIILDMSSFDIILRNDVYPYIAHRHDIHSCSTIDHSIRNAINTAYRDSERKPSSNQMTTFHSRPKCKEFIMLVAEKVCQQMCKTLSLTQPTDMLIL